MRALSIASPGSRERRIEPAQVLDDPGRARQPLGGRLRRLVEQRRALGHPGIESLGVLQAPQLAPQRVLLALLQPGGVELAHLKAQQILALDAVPLGRA